MALFEEKKANEWEPEDNNELDDVKEDDFDDVDSDDVDFEDVFDGVFDGVFDDNEVNDEKDEVSEISADENKLVEDWWKKYNQMINYVVKREHLVRFMDRYPHLVDHLELHWEALCDIGQDHYTMGKYDIFVEILLRVRNEFPNTYKKCAGVYDADLIYWYVAQGRIDEINPFFDRFKINRRGEFNNKLDNVINFLRAIDRADIVFDKIGEQSDSSIFFQVKFNRIISRYLDKPVNDETIGLIYNELLSNGIKKGWLGNEEHLKDRFQGMTRPFTVWDNNIPKKQSEAFELYLDILYNFTYFLYKIIGISYDCADFNAKMVYQFYKEVVYKKYRPKELFCLDRQSYEENMLLNNQDWFFFSVLALFQINAFYYFAAYLETCGNLTEEQKQAFQQYMIETYQKVYGNFKMEGPEMLLFEQFPYWGNEGLK